MLKLHHVPPMVHRHKTGGKGSFGGSRRGTLVWAFASAWPSLRSMGETLGQCSGMERVNVYPGFHGNVLVYPVVLA